MEESTPRVGYATGIKNRRIGNFVVGDELGRGAMGTVYLAVQQGLGRQVALEVLPSTGVGVKPELRWRFEREAAICARMSHPNIVRIFDYGFDGDVTCYVMALIEGRDLQTLLSQEPSPPSEVAECAAILRRFSDQDLTLTDALGLHLMKVRRIRSCWSTDFHSSLTGVPLAIA